MLVRMSCVGGKPTGRANARPMQARVPTNCQTVGTAQERLSPPYGRIWATPFGHAFNFRTALAKPSS